MFQLKCNVRTQPHFEVNEMLCLFGKKEKVNNEFLLMLSFRYAIK